MAATPRPPDGGVASSHEALAPRATLSGRAAAIWLLGLMALSALVRVLLVQEVHGPWIFPDELGYERLAQSIGQFGQLGLLGKQGLSYSPLYSLMLAPLFAFHLSAPSAYEWTRIINCGLMTCAAVPIYGIGRLVLSRREALVAAGLSLLAPLLFYTSMEMSENLAYPLFLFSVWAMIAAIRSPSARNDVALVISIVIASSARLQFAVLVPAAFCAVLLKGLVEAEGSSRVQRVVRDARDHLILTLATGIAAIVAIGALAGTPLTAIAGLYASSRHVPFPSPFQIVKLVLQHVADLDLAVGVLPFAAACFAIFIWLRRRQRSEVNTFAAVALSVTVFTVVATALTAYAISRSVPPAIPRIHERYIIYVVPLFLIAMVVVSRVPRTRTMLFAGYGAALISGLLPLLIPYGSVINNTIVADTFSLELFAKVTAGRFSADPHVELVATLFALFFSALFALARPKLLLVVVFTASVFLIFSAVVRLRIDSSAYGAPAATLPASQDWVDALGIHDGVAFIVGQRTRQLAVDETLFYNVSIDALYYRCQVEFNANLGSEYGEQSVGLDAADVLSNSRGPIHARYAVVPARSGVEGRVIARDGRGGLVLVEPRRGIYRVVAKKRSAWECAP